MIPRHLAATERLRQAHEAPPETRVLVHGGTCGAATGIERVAERLRGALGAALAADPELLVDAACDGACWAAPSATVVRPGHVHRFPRLDRDASGAGLEELASCLDGECEANRYAGAGERGGLMARLGRNDGSLGDVVAQGAYAAAARALTLPREAVTDAVERAGITGRGGAHFPTASKWRLAAAHERPLIVVNAEEGEPGAFKDRHMLEGDPHRLIEGIIIAAHALGSAEAYVYINGQARRARAAFEAALADAASAGVLGGDTLGSPVDVRIEVRSGAGGYVCGEESVILNSIEGERPVPRFRPPFATDRGLFDRPTVINNVESLCATTTIFDEPPPPTKLVPLSGDVPRPGLYEVPVDGATTWAGMLAMAGANPGQVQALLVGGPSGVFIPPDRFEEPLAMRALGSGGTVVVGPEADIAALTFELARYNSRESCGECTPCREGTERLVQLLDDTEANRERIDDLIEAMTEASLCALGGMAGRPVTSALELFPGAFTRERRTGG